MSSGCFYDTIVILISQSSKKLAIPHRSGTLCDMPKFTIDPFENIRKNAHIWHGDHSSIWYQEDFDDSFNIIVLYPLGKKKRRIVVEVNESNDQVIFKNDEVAEELYEKLRC